MLVIYGYTLLKAVVVPFKNSTMMTAEFQEELGQAGARYCSTARPHAKLTKNRVKYSVFSMSQSRRQAKSDEFVTEQNSWFRHPHGITVKNTPVEGLQVRITT